MTQGLGGILAQIISFPMLMSFTFLNWCYAVPLMVYGFLLFTFNMNQGFGSAECFFINWPHSPIVEMFLDKYSKNRKQCEHGNKWRLNKQFEKWFLVSYTCGSGCECEKELGGWESDWRKENNHQQDGGKSE